MEDCALSLHMKYAGCPTSVFRNNIPVPKHLNECVYYVRIVVYL